MPAAAIAAAFPEVILAIVAVALVIVFGILVYYLVIATLGQAPGIGSWVASTVTGIANGIVGTLANWAGTQEHSIVQWLNALGNTPHALWTQANALTTELTNRLHHLYTSDLPAATNGARDAAIGWARGADSALKWQIEGELGFAANSARDAAIGWAEGAVQAEHGWAFGAINALAGEVTSLQATVGTFPRYVDQQVGAMGASIQSWVAGQLGAERGWVAGEIDALQGWTRGAIDGLAGELGGIVPRIANLETAPIILGAAGVIAAVTTFEEFWNDCGPKVCNVIGPIDSLINELSSLFSLGAIVGWLAYCVEHPEAAASDTMAVGGPIAHEAMRAVEAVV